MHNLDSEYTLEVLTPLPLKWHLYEAHAPAQLIHPGSVLICSFPSCSTAWVLLVCLLSESPTGMEAP